MSRYELDLGQLANDIEKSNLTRLKNQIFFEGYQMNSRTFIGRILIFALAMFGLLLQTACMTVEHGGAVIQSVNSKQYSGRKIAALPVKTQAGLATDSILPLRQVINKSVGKVAGGKLPKATVLDVATVANELNQRNLLPAYEQALATYENTGVIDRRQVKALAQGLGCDYLLFTRLKAEKMDIIISRGFGASIDAMLVNGDSGEVTWSGTGEWKRGGVYGFGETKLDEAAMKLLELAFASLESFENAAAAATADSAATPKAPTGIKAKSLASQPQALPPKPVMHTATLKQVQSRLSELGYQPGTADGKMGQKTVAALKKFQQDKQLPKTGKADAETVAKLFENSESFADQASPSKKPITESVQKSAPAKSGNLSDL